MAICVGLLCSKYKTYILLVLVIFQLTFKTTPTFAKPYENDDLLITINSLKSSCSENVCLTKGCIRAANNFYESISFNVKPCDDFYEFVCGNWNKDHVLSEDVNSYNHFTELQNKLQVALKNSLNNVKPNDYPPFIKAANLFKACMQEDSINKMKGAPLSDLLNEVIGGWPLLMKNEWQEKNFDLNIVLADLQHYGVAPLIVSGISADLQNNSVHTLSIDQPSFGLIKEFLLQDVYVKERDAYVKYITDVVELLNQNRLSEDQKMEIEPILKFERDLAKILSTREERRNTSRLYNPMTVLEIQEKYKNMFDFEKFFRRLLKNMTVLKSDDIVVIVELEYITQLGNLIEQTPKRVISNFLNWRFAQEFVIYLSFEFHEARLKFMKFITGATKYPERWRSCIDYTNSQLRNTMGKLYVDSHFNDEAKHAIDALIKDLRDAFKEILEKTDWMDPDTKNYALLKLQKMQNKIAYPEIYNYPSDLEKNSASLIISADNHFQNRLNLLEFATKHYIGLLSKPVDKKKWPTGAAVINAFHDMRNNAILFPAAFLQPPFFDPDRPRSMNYGAIGKIIGHEITHGFDDRGKQFDADGNLHKWWSDSAESNFVKKAQCMIDQYENYYVPEVNLTINGLNTLGENIGDNGGLKEAFAAYKKAEILHGAEPLLPGLDFSHDQLFFISYAYNFCGIDRNEKLKLQILRSSHTPNKYRVNGALSNSPDFLKTFKCSIDSRMFNKNPCSVW